MKIALIIICVIVFVFWIIRYLNPYKRIAKNISIWYKNITTVAKQKGKDVSLERILELTGILSQGFDVKQKKISIQTIKRIAEESINNDEDKELKELNSLLFFIKKMQYELMRGNNTMNWQEIDSEILSYEEKTRKIIVKVLLKPYFRRLTSVQRIFENYPEIWDGDYSNLLKTNK